MDTKVLAVKIYDSYLSIEERVEFTSLVLDLEHEYLDKENVTVVFTLGQLETMLDHDMYKDFTHLLMPFSYTSREWLSILLSSIPIDNINKILFHNDNKQVASYYQDKCRLMHVSECEEFAKTFQTK